MYFHICIFIILIIFITSITYPFPILTLNLVDVILDDVFRLLSLVYLTVGLNRSAPATYSSLSTVQNLLEHLHESQVYSDKDTAPIRKRLEEIKQIVQDDSSSEFPESIQLIKRKLDLCFQTLKEVEEPMNALFEGGLSDTLGQLVTLRREILAIGSKPKFNPSDLQPLKQKLHQIEDTRDDEGHFITTAGVPASEKAQGALDGLLDECQNLLRDFSAASKTNIPKQVEHLYDELIEMKSRLENLLITHRWTLRETDLYTYQNKLDALDAERQGPDFAKFAGAKASAIILYLLRRCYAILYKLLESSQPVSEALIPIHNQLSTVRRCLLEVQRNGGLSSVRELYPYQMKLASIDNLRVDGKFMVGESVPEGQGMLIALLSECFEICHELKVDIEDNAPEDDGSEDGNQQDEEGIQFTEGAGDKEHNHDDEPIDDLDGVALQKIPSY